MKKKHFILWAAISFLAGIWIMSCTKEGPAGPTGDDGDDGIQTCYYCHNMSEDLLSIITQYDNSVHAMGANVDRNTFPCSQCHTSMGFRHALNDSMPTEISNPTPINCRTCHNIHETYTYDDYALRTTDSVVLELSGELYDYGKSNICANCHHARIMDPMPSLGGSDVTISNRHYGPHHGTQADMLLGKGGFEIEGSVPYLNSAHTNLVEDGCVTCHMAAATGIHSAGHQMNIKSEGSYGSADYEFAGCFTSNCHTDEDALTALIDPNRELIDSLLVDLKDTLIARSVLASSGSLSTPVTLTAEQAAAYLNYLIVEEDKSAGAHNFKYAKALLINSIEALSE